MYDVIIRLEDFNGDISGLITKICFFYVIAVPLSLFIIFRLSFYFISEKNTIRKMEIPSVAMSLLVFFIVIFLIDFFYNFQSIKTGFNENESLKRANSLVATFGSEEEIEEYEKMKNELKSGLNTILVVYTVLALACYAGMVPYSKKLLLANSVDDGLSPIESQDEHQGELPPTPKIW